MHLRRNRILGSPKLVAGVALLAGVVGTWLSLVVENPYVVTLGPLVGIGGLLGYLFMDREPTTTSVPLPEWTVTAVAVLVLGGVVASYLATGYQRTFPVHVGLVALYALVLLGVFSVPSASAARFLPLALLVGLVHRWMIYYASAVQLGIDAQFHVRMAARIAEAGSIAPLAHAHSKYWYAPLFHVVTGATSQLLGITARDAAFVAVSIPTMVVPVLAVYALVRTSWSPRVATVGGLLYLVSDQALAKSVHAATTSLGVVFFAALLYLAVRYHRDGGVNRLVAFVIVLAALVTTHQLSLPIATVGVTVYAVLQSAWRGDVERTTGYLVGFVWLATAVQMLVTKINGPFGDWTIYTYFTNTVTDTYREFVRSGGGRVAESLPAGVDFVVNSSNALSWLHTLGIAGLFGLSVAGAVIWLNHSDLDDAGSVVALGGIVATMSVIVFVFPLAGISFMLPARWFPFMYVPLGVLAAPALVALIRTDGGRRGVLAVCLVVVLVFTPYAAAMAWNYPGALDGPVFDDSSKAYRLTTTDTEAAAFQHAIAHDDDAAVVMSRRGYLTIGRGADHPREMYGYDYNRKAVEMPQPALLVDWAYAHTRHGSYSLYYGERWLGVFGPLPQDRATLDATYSVVYAAGPDRLVYVPSANATAG